MSGTPRVLAKGPITIMLVDDHPIVREGYRRLFERREGFQVVAEAENAADAYRLYRETLPKITVMDLSMAGPGGLEAIRHIRQWDGKAKILVFTMHQGAAFALKAFEAGAVGFVTKSSAPDELVRAVGEAFRGGRPVSSDIAREIAENGASGRASAVSQLSPRETEILRLFASGKPADEIAGALCLSLKTIQNYHYQIKQKAGVRTDAQLVWLAIGAGLLSHEAPEVGG